MIRPIAAGSDSGPAASPAFYKLISISGNAREEGRRFSVFSFDLDKLTLPERAGCFGL
jgi:hypothetical protein